jgi:hypothetical protein
LNQVVSIIGEGRIVQKLDIFSKKRYTAEPSNQFLQQKYSEHFDGRLFKTIETVLAVYGYCGRQTQKEKQALPIFRKKLQRTSRQMPKGLMLLKQSGCEPQFLFEKDFEYYISGYCRCSLQKPRF